jgi:hypothetical protein
MRAFVGTDVFLDHCNDDNDNGENEEEHELLFVRGVEELANQNGIYHDFTKAAIALEQAF